MEALAGLLDEFRHGNIVARSAEEPGMRRRQSYGMVPRRVPCRTGHRVPADSRDQWPKQLPMEWKNSGPKVNCQAM